MLQHKLDEVRRAEGLLGTGPNTSSARAVLTCSRQSSVRPGACNIGEHKQFSCLRKVVTHAVELMMDPFGTLGVPGVPLKLSWASESRGTTSARSSWRCPARDSSRPITEPHEARSLALPFLPFLRFW